MRTVITHFYNEEYLLPWWLKHHLPLFDHGILIDYSSTDSSAEICQSLAPHWRLVRSRNTNFEAIAADFEVMQYECELPGWKIALNTTEFLCNAKFQALEENMVHQNLQGCYFDFAVMVDPFPEQTPSYDLPLVAQKHYGFPGDQSTDNRGRLYHRASTGAYVPGRHTSYQPGLAKATGLGMVLWYNMSPWTQQTLKRKLQIQTRIPERDKQARLGWQHLTSAEELEEQRRLLLAKAVDLLPLINGG
jgi:hypothetical protein